MYNRTSRHEHHSKPIFNVLIDQKGLLPPGSECSNKHSVFYSLVQPHTMGQGTWNQKGMENITNGKTVEDNQLWVDIVVTKLPKENNPQRQTKLDSH